MNYPIQSCDILIKRWEVSDCQNIWEKKFNKRIKIKYTRFLLHKKYTIYTFALNIVHIIQTLAYKSWYEITYYLFNIY